MLRDLPAARFEKLSLVIWRFGGGRCLMSQQGALRPAELREGCGAPANWLFIRCGFPENCLTLSHFPELN